MKDHQTLINELLDPSEIHYVARTRTYDTNNFLDNLERSIRLRIRYDSTTKGERQFLRSLLNEIINEREKTS